MKVAQVLDELMTSQNVTAYKMSKDTGISDRLIGYWRKGEKLPGAENLLTIANYFGISVDYLLTGQRPDAEPNTDEQELLTLYNRLSDVSKSWIKDRADALYKLEAPPKYTSEVGEPESRQIPFSVLKVSAGSGEYLDSVQMEPIRIVSNDRTAAADFAVKIAGDSMEPQYSDGDIVLVKSQPAVELGQIGIFIIDGHGYIKQLGERELISLNPDYANILLHEYQEIECKGLVLGVLEPSDILS